MLIIFIEKTQLNNLHFWNRCNILTLNDIKLDNVKHVTQASMKWNHWKCTCRISHLFIYFYLVSAVSEAVRKSDCQDLSLFMLTITTVSIVFGVAVIFISVMYCWTREKENIKKAKLLKSAEHDLNLRKNTSCTPPEISLTALTSLLHGNLIHQGYRSAIRLGTFNSHTVAIKVHPPSSHAECRNENKIYAQLGEHTNIAKVILWNRFLNFTSCELFVCAEDTVLFNHILFFQSCLCRLNLCLSELVRGFDLACCSSLCNEVECKLHKCWKTARYRF